jgi:Tfp pilus assembly protein PilF
MNEHILFSRVNLAAILMGFLFCLGLRADDPVEDAIARLREGKTQEAVELLRKALGENPSSIRGAYLLSQTLLDQEKVSEASEIVQKALALAPASADLLQTKGDIEFRTGTFTAAEMSYKKALQADGTHARAIYGLARVFQCASLKKTAVTLFRRAAELDPGDADIAGSYARFSATDAEQQAALEKYLAATRGAVRRRAQSLIARAALHKFLNGRQTNTLVTPYQPNSIHMEVLLDGRTVRGLALKVGVGDAKAVTLELDTGASGITITRRVAEKAQVVKIADMDLSGLGDERDPTGYVGFAERIRVGEVEFHNCVVHVSDRAFSSDSEGLIGTDIFERFLINLDFRKRELRLEPLPGPAWDGREAVDRYKGPELSGFSQVFRFGHELLIKTLVGESGSGLFLLDTGSSENLIAPEVARSVARVHGTDRFVMNGVSGKVKNLQSANEVTLAFAGYRQLIRDLLSLDFSGISRDAGTEVSGILGLPVLILFDLTIDYRDGMVKFVYNPPPGL